jgi:fumarate hydratase class II
MTTKYTPGPWQAYNAIGGRILNRWHIQGTKHKSLASVHAQDSSEEEAANALLIAAAPALAEALMAALPALLEAEEKWSNGEDCYSQVVEIARHALQDAGLLP